MTAPDREAGRAALAALVVATLGADDAIAVAGAIEAQALKARREAKPEAPADWPPLQPRDHGHPPYGMAWRVEVKRADGWWHRLPGEYATRLDAAEVSDAIETWPTRLALCDSCHRTGAAS